MMMTTGTLLHGPKVVWDTGVKKCIIEMISVTVLNWVKQAVDSIPNLTLTIQQEETKIWCNPSTP